MYLLPLARPPQLRVVTFLSYIRHIYNAEFGQYWTSLCSASSSALHCLICDFCSSDQEFALGLLHTPPHDGRTCPLLTVPTAKPVVDFNAHSVQIKTTDIIQNSDSTCSFLNRKIKYFLILQFYNFTK